MSATDEDVLGLVARPLPTYVVGVDEVSEKAYIVSANGERMSGFSSLSTAFSLDDDATREALWTEVNEFWRRKRRKVTRSRFSDPEWR